MSQAHEKGHYRELDLPEDWKDGPPSLESFQEKTLSVALKLEEAVLVKLQEPNLTPKDLRNLRGALRNARKVQSMAQPSKEPRR